VVAILEQRNLCFVVVGIPLQARNALFYGVAKSGADLESILGRASGQHGKLLEPNS
jgi:hypothetical protein